MKTNFLLSAFVACATVLHAGPVVVETPNISLVLDAENGKAPQYVYFGNKLKTGDVSRIQAPTGGRMDAYPAYGLNTPAEAAIAAPRDVFSAV